LRRTTISAGTLIALGMALLAMYFEWSADPVEGAIQVVDGDTVIIDGTRYRAANYDTPEFDPMAGCDAEVRLAQRATDRLRQLARDGLTVEPTGRRGGHDRPLARFILSDGTDVADIMVRENLAVYWGNGTPDWCR